MPHDGEYLALDVVLSLPHLLAHQATLAFISVSWGCLDKIPAIEWIK